MKICLMPHNNTAERFSHLSATLREHADIIICFPGEDFSKVNADIVLLEEETPSVVQQLLSLDKPPLIVYPKNGVSTGQIRYLPNFSVQFPKLLKEFPKHYDTVCFQYKNQRYRYKQEDILYLQEKRSLTIRFRYGNEIRFRQWLHKIAKQLSPLLFFPVGETVMVNAEYVKEVLTDAMILQNGQKIPLDSSVAEQVQNAYFKTKYLKNCN